MLKILMAFMPFHDLLNKEGNEYYKTGTLSDVRCRAGFIQGNDKKLYPFVIMINGKNKGYDSIHRDLLRRVDMITKGNWLLSAAKAEKQMRQGLKPLQIMVW